MPKLYFHRTSEYANNALSNLYGSTLSPYIKHKIDGLLLAYGENDETYIEPVYGITSGKRSEWTSTDRPDKPLTTFALQLNPAKNYTELHWDGFAEGLQNAFTINIYSSTGNRVRSLKEEDYMKNIRLITTKDFNNGLYILKVLSKEGKQLFTQKLIVLK